MANPMSHINHHCLQLQLSHQMNPTRDERANGRASEGIMCCHFQLRKDHSHSIKGFSFLIGSSQLS